MSRVFRIDFRSTFTLSDRDLWPDGDAPEDPTVEDVAARLEAYGGARRVIMDWNLGDLRYFIDVYEPAKNAEK